MLQIFYRSTLMSLIGRRVTAVVLALCFLSAVGAGVQAGSCDDCLDLSCCAMETENDPCAEQCGPCDDEAAAPTQVLTPRANLESQKTQVAYLEPVNRRQDMIPVIVAGHEPTHPRLLQTLSLHIPTTILLA